jgi:hypothetical protein
VRIWEEVHYSYKVVAEKHGLLLSDLASLVLIYGPLLCPLAVVEALQEAYGVSRKEAMKIAEDLMETLTAIIKMAESAEAEERAEVAR